MTEKPRRDHGKTYLLTRIPEDLWRTVRLCAELEEVSIRDKIIELLLDWTQGFKLPRRPKPRRKDKS